MKKIIHVNQHHIKYNAKNDIKKPVLTIKSGKENCYANEIEILGPSKVIYSPDKPLSCGAKVWIETDAEILYKDKVKYSDIAKLIVKKMADDICNVF